MLTLSSTTDNSVLIRFSNYDYNKNEESLIKIKFESSQRAILTPAKLGESRKDKKEEFVGVLEQVNIYQLVNLNLRDEYDQWFDDIVLPFHRAISII